MLNDLEKKPVLRIEMTVKSNTTKKTSDKADAFGVGLKSRRGTLTIGLKEANAVLTIKGEDDVIHFNFPTDDEFIVEIYPKRRSTFIRGIATQQTPLTETESTDFAPEETELAKNLGSKEEDEQQEEQPLEAV